jgi:hypothetical protein
MGTLAATTSSILHRIKFPSWLMSWITLPRKGWTTKAIAITATTQKSLPIVVLDAIKEI